VASTYSPILKLELVGTGDQSGVWGTTTNNNLGTLLEQAIAGTATINVTSSDVVLTDLNGITDQARCAALLVTGTPGTTRYITAPNVSKLYVVSNTSNASVVIKTSISTGYTIATGNTQLVYYNGTDFILVGQTISPLAENLYGGAANQFPYQTSPNVTTFLAAPTVAGTGIVWDGTSLSWGIVGGAVASGAIYENSQIITATYTMTVGKNGSSVGPITIDGGVTVTIPAGSTWLVL
jgi:hypothetical protein